MERLIDRCTINTRFEVTRTYLNTYLSKTNAFVYFPGKINQRSYSKIFKYLVFLLELQVLLTLTHLFPMNPFSTP